MRDFAVGFGKLFYKSERSLLLNIQSFYFLKDSLLILVKPGEFIQGTAGLYQDNLYTINAASVSFINSF